jgi:PAS domain S-box-containing protein
MTDTLIFPRTAARGEANAHDVLDALPVAVYATDAEGRILYFNPAAEALWGRAPVPGQDKWCGSLRLFWPDGRPMALDECPMAITLKNGSPVRGAEAILERPDGSRARFAPFPAPLFNTAGKLTGAVNVLIDTSSLASAEEAKQRVLAIVESSSDAIVSKDLNGIITSWNDGAQRLFGYTANEVIGQPVTILIPRERLNEESEIISRIRRGERVDHYETVRLRKDGTEVDVSLTVSPVRGAGGAVAGASKIARDITERKRADAEMKRQARQLATLNRIAKVLSRDLDLERIVQSVTDIATELSGAKFGAFFYNVVNVNGESYQLFSLSGAPREAFESFGMPRNTAVFEPTFRGQGVVRSDDIRNDPRYGKSGPHYGQPEGHLPVVSYLAVPVVSRSGDVLGGLFFGHDQAGVFTQEAEAIVVGIAAHAAVAMDNARLHQAAQFEVEQRKRAEQAKQLLLDEIKHRVKNTLGTVQSIASQTFRKAPPEERDAFSARLRTLAEAHDLLTSRNWERALVGDVIDRALAPFRLRRAQQFRVGGDEVWVDAGKSVLLCLAIHELATNALKYGALTMDTGHVDIDWKLDDDTRRLRLIWRESGGPPVTPPERKGFGSALIERALKSENGATKMDYSPTGVVCTLDVAV